MTTEERKEYYKEYYKENKDNIIKYQNKCRNIKNY